MNEFGLDMPKNMALPGEGNHTKSLRKGDPAKSTMLFIQHDFTIAIHEADENR